MTVKELIECLLEFTPSTYKKVYVNGVEIEEDDVTTDWDGRVQIITKEDEVKFG